VVTDEALLEAFSEGQHGPALVAWSSAYNGRAPTEPPALAAFVVGAGLTGRREVRAEAADRLSELGLPGGIAAQLERAAGAGQRLLGLATGPLDDQGRLIVARALAGAGRFDEAAALVPRGFERSARATGQCGVLLRDCGSFDEAADVLRSADGDPNAAVALEELALWRGGPSAGGIAGRAGLRIAGVRAGESGRELLERANAEGDPEARRWLAERALRGGDPVRAESLLAGAWATRFDLVTQLLLVGTAAAAPGRWERLMTAHPLPFDGFLDEVAPGLPGGEAIDRSHAEGILRWVLGLLERMGHNRSDRPTLGRGQDLVPLRAPPTSREIAAAALDQLGDGGPGAAFAALDAAEARFPDSPHPWTYRGEVLLWMGRVDEAAASLREAQRRARCRWGWVGLSAAAGLRGLDRTADRAAALSLRDFGPLAGSTLAGYRGERLSRHGQTDEARGELEAAVKARPARIGAWVALAELGSAAAWDQLEARAPALMFEARRGAQTGTVAEIRALLAGNRASRMVTIARGHDGLRVLGVPAEWARVAKRLRGWLVRRR
jgi:tetratricopeptide (TPR) repeat protein